MGKDPNEEAKRKPQRRKFNRRSSGTADWMSVDAETIRAALATVALAGGALRLGYTSDAGAYAIGIYGDGDPYTEYVRPGESVEDLLLGIQEAFG